jgi:hypothetical protein
LPLPAAPDELVVPLSVLELELSSVDSPLVAPWRWDELVPGEDDSLEPLGVPLVVEPLLVPSERRLRGVSPLAPWRAPRSLALADADALGDALAEAEALAEGEALADGETDALAEAVAIGEAVALAEPVFCVAALLVELL